MFEHDGGGVVAGEGFAAGQQGVGDHPQGVEVAGAVERQPLDLLGRHVHRRADHLAGAGEVGGGAVVHPRDAEIEHLGAVLDQDHVARFEVAVHDLQAVRFGQCRGDFEQKFAHPAGMHGRRQILDHLVEPGAFEQLHVHKNAARITADVVNPHHVRVHDFAADLQLAPQPFLFFVVARRRDQGFDRHHLASQLVVRAVDPAHAAAADFRADLEAVVQELTGDEPEAGQRPGHLGNRRPQQGIGRKAAHQGFAHQRRQLFFRLVGPTEGRRIERILLFPVDRHTHHKKLHGEVTQAEHVRRRTHHPVFAHLGRKVGLAGRVAGGRTLEGEEFAQADADQLDLAFVVDQQRARRQPLVGHPQFVGADERLTQLHQKLERRRGFEAMAAVEGARQRFAVEVFVQQQHLVARHHRFFELEDGLVLDRHHLAHHLAEERDPIADLRQREGNQQDRFAAPSVEGAEKGRTRPPRFHRRPFDCHRQVGEPGRNLDLTFFALPAFAWSRFGWPAGDRAGGGWRGFERNLLGRVGRRRPRRRRRRLQPSRGHGNVVVAFKNRKTSGSGRYRHRWWRWRRDQIVELGQDAAGHIARAGRRIAVVRLFADDLAVKFFGVVVMAVGFFETALQVGQFVAFERAAAVAHGLPWHLGRFDLGAVEQNGHQRGHGPQINRIFRLDRAKCFERGIGLAGALVELGRFDRHFRAHVGIGRPLVGACPHKSFGRPHIGRPAFGRAFFRSGRTGKAAAGVVKALRAVIKVGGVVEGFDLFVKFGRPRPFAGRLESRRCRVEPAELFEQAGAFEVFAGIEEGFGPQLGVEVRIAAGDLEGSIDDAGIEESFDGLGGIAGAFKKQSRTLPKAARIKEPSRFADPTKAFEQVGAVQVEPAQLEVDRGRSEVRAPPQFVAGLFEVHESAGSVAQLHAALRGAFEEALLLIKQGGLVEKPGGEVGIGRLGQGPGFAKKGGGFFEKPGLQQKASGGQPLPGFLISIHRQVDFAGQPVHLRRQIEFFGLAVRLGRLLELTLLAELVTLSGVVSAEDHAGGRPRISRQSADRGLRRTLSGSSWSSGSGPAVVRAFYFKPMVLPRFPEGDRHRLKLTAR